MVDRRYGAPTTRWRTRVEPGRTGVEELICSGDAARRNTFRTLHEHFLCKTCEKTVWFIEWNFNCTVNQTDRWFHHNERKLAMFSIQLQADSMRLVVYTFFTVPVFSHLFLKLWLLSACILVTSCPSFWVFLSVEPAGCTVLLWSPLWFKMWSRCTAIVQDGIYII